MIIIQHDDFLNHYYDLAQYAKDAIFRDEVNPDDGVTYPLICKEIPRAIWDDVRRGLSEYMGQSPEIHALFMRRSPAGVHVPHVAHNDAVMGRYSLMLYLDDQEGSGTAFLRHKESGIMYQPESKEFVDTVVRDQNSLDKWVVSSMTQSKANRAAIFDSSIFHCAMPVGGYGEGNSARTVLTCFFS
jgi:hypothetical protein